MRPIKVDAPWDIVGIDIIGIGFGSFRQMISFLQDIFFPHTSVMFLFSSSGPFPETEQGNKSAIVVIDYFTKWPEAFPVQKTDALSVARCISKCIYRYKYSTMYMY